MSKLPYTRSQAKAWGKKHIKGFIQDPITPFHDDFSFDEAGMRYNIQKILQEVRPDGLIYGGNIGECWDMTPAEFKRYLTVSAEETRGKTMLVGIAIDPSPFTVLEKINLMEELGYECIELMTPSFQVRADEDIYEYFKYITDRTDMAIVLYNTPAAGKVMSHELINRLADIETVVGIKQGLINWGDSMRLRRVVGDKIVVSEPIETYWLFDHAFAGGQCLWATLELTLYGKKRDLIRQYTKLAEEGRIQEAFEVYKELAVPRVLQEELLFWALPQKGVYTIAGIKYWFELLGLKTGPVRPPQKALSRQEKDEIRSALSAGGVI